MRPDHPVTRRGPAGFTLVELIVAILISTVVIGAAWKLLTANQRFYRSQSQIQDVQQNLRAAVQIVMGDLREMDAKGGDIIAMDTSSLTIRAMRGFGVVCKINVGGGRIWLKNSLLFMSGSIDVTKDNVMVYREADSTKNSDDTWEPGTITDKSSDNCADGTAGTRLDITLANGNTKLDSVAIGAPVRIWEQVKYELYNTNGAYWLGTDTWTSGAWPGTTSVAGPLTSNGVSFTYYDSTGAVNATASRIAYITMTVRAQSAQPIMVQGRPTGPYLDSVIVSATLRNN